MLSLLQKDFPHTVSCNRFVELQRELSMPLTVFVNMICTGSVPRSLLSIPRPFTATYKKGKVAQDIQGHRRKEAMFHRLVLQFQTLPDYQRQGGNLELCPPK